MHADALLAVKPTRWLHGRGPHTQVLWTSATVVIDLGALPKANAPQVGDTLKIEVRWCLTGSHGLVVEHTHRLAEVCK